MPNWQHQTVYIVERGYAEARAKNARWFDVSAEVYYDTLEFCLDAYGSRGWELVSVVGVIRTYGTSDPVTAGYRAFFKAPA